MAKSYVSMCGMKDCKNKRDAQGRFGVYCYWHRNYNPNYIKSGGDNKTKTLFKNGLGKGRKYVFKGKTYYDLSSEIPPLSMHSSYLASGLDMSNSLSKKLAWASLKLNDQNDTIPKYVLENSQERFDKLGSFLMKTGIKPNDIGIMHLKGFNIRPFSDSIDKVGVESHFPQVEHDVIIVYDSDTINGSKRVFALDPSIAALAPVGDRGKEIDVKTLPPERTPFSDGVHIAPAENYLKSPLMSWDKFGVKWMNEFEK